MATKLVIQLLGSILLVCGLLLTVAASAWPA